MGQIGMGVMLQTLSGGNRITPEQYESLREAPIVAVELRDSAIRIRLDDGKGTLVLTDEGQSCCENRYITTNDDLGYFATSKFYDVEVGEHRTKAGEHGDEHEIQFLNVRTSKGVITFETHNEHNGYYGGFAITAKLQQ